MITKAERMSMWEVKKEYYLIESEEYLPVSFWLILKTEPYWWGKPGQDDPSRWFTNPKCGDVGEVD